MSDFRFDGIPNTGAVSENPSRAALRACLMPDDLYEQVRAALGLREFESSDIEEGSEFDGPTCI